MEHLQQIRRYQVILPRDIGIREEAYEGVDGILADEDGGGESAQENTIST